MIKPVVAAVLAVGLLAACSNSQLQAPLQSPAGQLFCAIQTQGGGTIVAGLISGAVSPGAAPLVVLATNAGQAAVNADCAKAAAATGGAAGIPVSPPALPGSAPLVAIASPSSPVAAPGA